MYNKQKTSIALGTTVQCRSQQRTDQRVLVLTMKFLALKNLVFHCKKYFPKFFWFFFYLYSMELFSVDAIIFSKKKLNLFFAHENLKKNGPQKLLIISPKFFFHSTGPAAQISPELIFHFIHMCQDSSVSLSVLGTTIQNLLEKITIIGHM